ncbi:MAG: helix-turn-helix domain-containing protein [Methylotenera sp.]|nr:helix-turn-helix domain-containing protein [Methylotenera sp.]MDP2281757.1 helix-turn-helix domain-containing protein [Methylotenera sp.]MDP3059293.1 helix-turn-helix domain-containing protein [Methylotenera sp.]
MTTKFTDNSAFNQRLKLLDWLFERGNISTSEARENLDIMSPAPRIMELKRAGYSIVTLMDNWTGPHGINHKRIARYVLTQKQPLETIENSEVA